MVNWIHKLETNQPRLEKPQSLLLDEFTKRFHKFRFCVGMAIEQPTDPIPEAEPEPQYCSADIDDGRKCGMRLHPITGQEFQFLNIIEVCKITGQMSIQRAPSSGWSNHSASKETLPRIGDRNPHTVSELQAGLKHWKWNPFTGEPINRTKKEEK